MDVSITARGGALPDIVRQRTTERLERLARYNHRVGSATVNFDREGGVKRVEAVIRVGGRAVVAHGDGQSYRAALDQAADRLARQLKRQRDRQRTRRGQQATPEPPVA
jgi:putative sigma-54 modulation protein